MIFVCFIFFDSLFGNRKIEQKKEISMNNNNISMNGGKNGSDKLVVPLVCLFDYSPGYFKRKYVPIYRNDFSLVSAYWIGKRTRRILIITPFSSSTHPKSQCAHHSPCIIWYLINGKLDKHFIAYTSILYTIPGYRGVVFRWKASSDRHH